jgi:hypothetical protein
MTAILGGTLKQILSGQNSISVKYSPFGIITDRVKMGRIWGGLTQWLVVDLRGQSIFKKNAGNESESRLEM